MPNWFCRLDTDFRRKLNTGSKDYKAIAEKCDLVIQALAKLDGFCDRLARINRDTAEWLRDQIEETRDHFNFCKSFATGEITQSEWQEYDFDGDLIGMFDDYLSEFWDICDSWINRETKFCWVAI